MSLEKRFHFFCKSREIFLLLFFHRFPVSANLFTPDDAGRLPLQMFFCFFGLNGNLLKFRAYRQQLQCILNI